MNQLRAMAVVLCGLVFVIGVVGGVISIYVSRTLFNQEMFSDRVSECFSEPHIAGVVASKLTDQIVALRRDLTPYRPVLLSVMERVVSSPPFRTVVKLAAKKLHPTLITHGESLSLTLQDLGLIVRNALALYPQIAEKMPAQAQLYLGSTEKWPSGKILLRVLQIGHRMERRAFLWPSLGLLLGGLGLALARRRDIYLLRVGLGLTIVALLVAGVARFGGYIVAGLIASPTASDLVLGTWLVFLAPLALRMLVLAALGTVIVAAVTTLLEKIEPAVLVKHLWSYLRRRPARPEWIMARGLAVATIGVVIALRPLEALAVLAISAAALVFFIGIQDVFVTAAQITRVGAHAKAARQRRRSIVPAAIGVGVILLLGAGAAIWLVRGPEPTAAHGPVAILACNGYAELRDRRFNQVVFPTTHNSMASADIPDWMMPNQERGIRQQLEDGIRGFQVDIHYGQPVQGRIKTLFDNEANARAKYEEVLGKEGVEAALRIRNRLVGKPEGEKDVYLGHGFCELGATRFVTTLEEIKDFLVLNPNEILIMIIQDEGVSPADVASCFEKSGLVDFVYRGPVSKPWPTLGEMAARNERVVVLAENEAEGVPWYHRMIGVLQETPYKFKTPEEFSNGPNRGGKVGSLLLMNNFIESVPPVPSKAEPVNAYDFLLSRARACRRQRGMVPNLIAVDFYRTGDLFKVCRAMNGISELAGPTIP